MLRCRLLAPLAALVLVLSSSPAAAQRADATPTPAEIVALDQRLNQLILAHDVDAARALYDDAFVLTTSGGGMKSKADMLADIGNPAVVLTVCETTDVEVRIRGNTAILTGTLRQAGTVGGRAIDVRLRVTDTWVRVDGVWRLLAGHASRHGGSTSATGYVSTRGLPPGTRSGPTS